MITEEEYREGLKELDDRHKKERLAYITKCAKENSPFTLGETITDGESILKIEKILVSCYMDSLPKCFYSGVELKKNREPKKRQGELYISQDRARKV